MIKVSAPGKVHLIGEHAVVYNEPAIIAAIGKRIWVEAEKNDTKVIMKDRGISHEAEWMVRDAIDRGELYAVADAPAIERQAYAVYRPDCANPELLEEVLRLARGQR